MSDTQETEIMRLSEIEEKLIGKTISYIDQHDTDNKTQIFFSDGSSLELTLEYLFSSAMTRWKLKP